jgi:hypothetical protein
VPRAAADDGDDEVVEVTQERRRAHERVEILRMPDVAGVHDDEAVGQPLLARPLVVLRRGVIALVSTQFGITTTRSGRAPFSWSRRCIVSPIATTRSARRK